MKSRLVWVAVPGGALVDGTAVLRVVVVPQLGTVETPDASGTPTLADYGLENWPALLEEALSTLNVEVAPTPDRAESIPDTALDVRRHATLSQSELWRTCFPAALEVEPWIPQAERGQHEFDPPVVPPVAVSAVEINKSFRELARALEAERPAHVVNTLERLAGTFEAADREQREQASRQQRGRDRNGARQAEPLDFHRTLTMLREHPTVLRVLGLILDVSVDGAKLPQATAEKPWLVRAGCTVPGLATASPWTRYQYDEEHFLPAPREDSDVKNGALDLQASGRWEITTFDVNGAIGRLRDEVQTLRQATPGAEPATLPALRSAGLSLVRRDRRAEFEAHMRTAQNHAAQELDKVELTADDLTLGYRVDVVDQHGKALSLCRRIATYLADGNVLGTGAEPEEGHVKAHAAAWDEVADALVADETVARWEGWSLAVPRPISSELSPADQRSARFPTMPFDFTWEFQPPSHRNGHGDSRERLPKLRFGTTYSLRVRVADIAGGGLSVAAPTVANISPSVVYLRYDPVPPPEVIPPPGVITWDEEQGRHRVDHEALGPGGDIEHLVVRSDPEGKPARDADYFATRYPPNATRELRPPRGSFALAEQHGMFDGVDSADTWEWVRDALESDDGETYLRDPGAAGVRFAIPAPTPEHHGLSAPLEWGDQWPAWVGQAIELRAARTSTRLLREDFRMVIELVPAAEVTLRMSSYIPDGYASHLQVTDWRGPTSNATVREGRDEMVTPARELILVHAVRRPLLTPAGRFDRRREPDELFATLHPEPEMMNIDAASTAQLDIEAEWSEQLDNPDDGEPRRLPITAQLVASLPITRDHTAIGAVRHEFPDTKHRRVTYRLNAISRFRDHFEDDEPVAGEVEPEYRATSKDILVSIPNSARPTPPTVRSALPAYRWRDLAPPDRGGIRRTRSGGILRVELARPWHETGEEEQLAVLPFRSTIGRDPLWETAKPLSVKTLDPEFFADPDEHLVLLPDETETTVLPYDVWFEEGSWWCDVEMPELVEHTYCPFVQLVVARFQWRSIAGRAISMPVTVEPVQLWPKRTLTVNRLGDRWQVLLEGVGPTGPSVNQVVAALERCRLPAGVDPTEVALTTVAEPVGGVPAWSRVPGADASGTLNELLEPLDFPQDDYAYRVIVRETEKIQRDAAAASPVSPIGAELAARTVFLDTVLLSVP